MTKGSVYYQFGYTWIVDDVYSVPDDAMMSEKKPFGLFYRTRYKAHVIDAPDGYKGDREIDAALVTD